MHITINLGISSSFIVLVLLMAVSLCSVIFLTLKSIMREDLRTAVKNAVSNGVHLVDGDAMDTIQTEEDMKSENYAKLRDQLVKIKNSTAELRFVYTMRTTKDGIIFVVDAEPDDSEDKSPTGEVYDEATDELLRSLSGKGSVEVENDVHTDSYGTWLSGYAPIYNSENKLAGILGMDVSAQSISQNETQAFLLLIGVSGGVCVIVLIIGILISRRITTPLRNMEKDMTRITKFDLSETQPVHSVFAEINNMASVIDDVKASLRSFKKYVPADLVAELIQGHGEAKLGATKKELTILFSDIEGFTTWSEKLPPEKLIQGLSIYFGGMTEIIMRNHGTVDKYIGDAIMAFWGAPNDLEDHTYWACKAALECVALQKEMNKEFETLGLPPLNTRFGINVGEVMVGNVGYENRFNYTVLGDHVNLASRLEGLNKMYDTNIIISQNAAQKIQGKFILRILDKVVVKGKTSSIQIFELMAELGTENEKVQSIGKFAAKANSAMKAYFQHEWESAINDLESLLVERPENESLKLILSRCLAYKKNDPGKDWEGAIVLREK